TSPCNPSALQREAGNVFSSQSPMAAAAATPAHEKRLEVVYARQRGPWNKVGTRWCCEPASQSDLGGRRHLRLWPPCGEHAHQNRVERPPRGAVGGGAMETEEPISVVHPCCCGLDVHKRQVQACLLRSTPGGRVQQEQRTFGTMTDDLLVLLDWLVAEGCTH